MAKGPIVTNEIESFIARVYDEHRTWNAKQVQREVSYLLHKENPQLPKGWPGLSAVQKVLAKVRKGERELPVDPQDEPWSMASLETYPILPEALSHVLQLWQIFNLDFGMTFTIRDAKWTARLYHLLKEKRINALTTMVINYSWNEKAARLAQVDFVSTGIDLFLLSMLKEEALSSETIQMALRHQGITSKVTMPWLDPSNYLVQMEMARSEAVKALRKAKKNKGVENERAHNKEG